MSDMDDEARALAFAKDVEAALTGISASERASLTSGLVDHLLEPGEDGERPIDREPDPALYAAELQGAIGVPTGRGMKTGRRSRSTKPSRLILAAVVTVVAVAAVGIGLAVGFGGQGPAVTEPSATPMVQVPDVYGLTLDQAESQLTSAGFNVDITLAHEEDVPAYTGLASGEVFQTDPMAGSLVDRGSDVMVWVVP